SHCRPPILVHPVHRATPGTGPRYGPVAFLTLRRTPTQAPAGSLCLFVLRVLPGHPRAGLQLVEPARAWLAGQLVHGMRVVAPFWCGDGERPALVLDQDRRQIAVSPGHANGGHYPKSDPVITLDR